MIGNKGLIGTARYASINALMGIKHLTLVKAMNNLEGMI